MKVDTAQRLLRNYLGKTDLSDNQVADHLVRDDTFSIQLAAAYIAWMETRTVDGKYCGAGDPRELFIQYAVDDALACALRDYNYDIDALAYDAAVQRYVGDEQKLRFSIGTVRARASYYESSIVQARAVMTR